MASASNPMRTETVRAFVKHVQSHDDYPTQAREFVEKNWAERSADEDADWEPFIAESLAVLSPRFRMGLDEFDEERFDQAFVVMSELSADDDPYLSANANVFAIKALVEQDKLEEARDRLESMLTGSADVDLYTTYTAELTYLRGYLALRDLQYDDAARHLQNLLQTFRDAGPRLRVSAEQILAELNRREPERMGDVADLMVYSGGRLNQSDTGAKVLERQQRAIDLLDQLIEEAQQREQQGSGGGAGGSSGSGRGGQQPSSPMQDSQLPGGGSTPEMLRSRRTARPGEVWGTMPPAEREKILQSLRESFPSRYRQLVEQYYEELGKQP